ncbi:MAG: dTMP kinase [Nitrospinae bacterium CG11_big_fil_rev_8_21_14_0_20_56_8]|nr:MAG: dTMP kinase [Nitrospinae bacterium CG11_big_fil_rev_8_21_14_0_20_56_8]
MTQGYLIVFEGIDGTGKSTHCRMLADFLNERGTAVTRLREPTDGPWGRKIREILKNGRGGVTPEQELTWFVNDRREDVENNILPALRKNNVVLLDRYYYSTAAYQGALGIDPAKIIAANEQFAPVPDRAFIFIAPPETCLDRIGLSREGYSSFEKLEYLRRVQDIFVSFSGSHIQQVDSTRTPEEVHTILRDEVLRLIEPGVQT